MLKELNPLLHSELRLAIMSILVGVEVAEFSFMKKETNATSGNLSAQLDKLAAAGYITITKGFKGKKPCTSYSMTELGNKAFLEYVENLKPYLYPKPRS